MSKNSKKSDNHIIDDKDIISVLDDFVKGNSEQNNKIKRILEEFDKSD